MMGVHLGPQCSRICGAILRSQGNFERLSVSPVRCISRMIGITFAAQAKMLVALALK
jgi:hypothetical protein